MEVGLECPEEETQRGQTQENATGERAIETDVVMGRNRRGDYRGKEGKADDDRMIIERCDDSR